MIQVSKYALREEREKKERNSGRCIPRGLRFSWSFSLVICRTSTASSMTRFMNSSKPCSVSVESPLNQRMSTDPDPSLDTNRKLLVQPDAYCRVLYPSASLPWQSFPAIALVAISRNMTQGRGTGVSPQSELYPSVLHEVHIASAAGLDRLIDSHSLIPGILNRRKTQQLCLSMSFV